VTEKLSTERPAKPGPKQTKSTKGWIAARSDKVPFAALIVLLMIVLVMLFVNPAFLSGNNIRAVAEQSAIPVVVAVGLTFVILMGGIDLSVAGVMAAASLSSALLLANDRNALSLGLWVIPAGCAVGAALGLLAGLSVSVLRVPSFIVTIGTWQIGARGRPAPLRRKASARS
jgi:ribose transport system permease protein